MLKLKAGNTVRFTDTSGAGHAGSVKNRLYTIDRIDMGDLLVMVDSKGSRIAVIDSRVAFVAEGGLPFTNGDKVKVLTTGAQYTTYMNAANAMGLTAYMRKNTLKKDAVVTVLSAFQHESTYMGTLYGIEDEEGNQYVIGERGLEKYVAPVEPPKPEFKLGDRVRVKADITQPKYSWGSVKAGDVGVVSYISRTMMSVDFPTQSYWNAAIEEMELYTLTPLEAAEEEIERLKKVLDKKDSELLELRTKIEQVAEILTEI